MLRDKAVIGYMGLPEREISVIQSIFSLTERLHNTYELPRADEQRSPDVVFVNADDPAYLAEWHRYVSQRTTAIPVFVSSDGRSTDGGVSLKRPLVLKKIIDTLTAVRDLYSRSVAAEHDNAQSRDCLHILVVDDSLPVRTYMQQKLASLSSVVTRINFAESGDEAITRIKQGEEYDLVFMDVMMPGTDGYKTCKWIKANRPTYVVMLTSRSSPFDKVRGAMSGCDTYLVKPPQDSDLEAILSRRVGQITHSRSRAKGDSPTRVFSQ